MDPSASTREELGRVLQAVEDDLPVLLEGPDRIPSAALVEAHADFLAHFPTYTHTARDELERHAHTELGWVLSLFPKEDCDHSLLAVTAWLAYIAHVEEIYMALPRPAAYELVFDIRAQLDTAVMRRPLRPAAPSWVRLTSTLLARLETLIPSERAIANAVLVMRDVLQGFMDLSFRQTSRTGSFDDHLSIHARTAALSPCFCILAWPVFEHYGTLTHLLAATMKELEGVVTVLTGIHDMLFSIVGILHYGAAAATRWPESRQSRGAHTVTDGTHAPYRPAVDELECIDVAYSLLYRHRRHARQARLCSGRLDRTGLTFRPGSNEFIAHVWTVLRLASTHFHLRRQSFGLEGRVRPDMITSTPPSVVTPAKRLHGQDQLEAAASMQHKVLSKERCILGEDLPDTLSAMHNLTSTRQNQGQLEEAASM